MHRVRYSSANVDTHFACCSANTTIGAERGVFKQQQVLLRSASRKQSCVLYESLLSAIWWKQSSKVAQKHKQAGTDTEQGNKYNLYNLQK